MRYTICIILFAHIANSFTFTNRNVGTKLKLPATLDGQTIEGELAPTNNFILVKIADVQEETAGGIFLTGKAKTGKSEGIVVSTGPGKTHRESGYIFPMNVNVGEKVMYGKYDGTELTYDGIKHLLIQDDDVLVKFDCETAEEEQQTIENAQVLDDSVLIKIDKDKEITSNSGDILIAATSKKKKVTIGEVVKVGSGKISSNGTLMPVDVEEGDMVKFRDFATKEVQIGDDDYAVVKFVDLLVKY